MNAQKLIEQIYEKMEMFKRDSSCGRRQYLFAAAKLCEFEKRLSEMTNEGNEFDIEELQSIDESITKILKNLGIKMPQK